MGARTPVRISPPYTLAHLKLFQLFVSMCPFNFTHSESQTELMSCTYDQDSKRKLAERGREQTKLHLWIGFTKRQPSLAVASLQTQIMFAKEELKVKRWMTLKATISWTAFSRGLISTKPSSTVSTKQTDIFPRFTISRSIASYCTDTTTQKEVDMEAVLHAVQVIRLRDPHLTPGLENWEFGSKRSCRLGSLAAE